MFRDYHPYLREVGLSEIQIMIYDYILENRSGTINDIKDKLNLSYSQASYNLNMLEEQGLVFSSKSKKNRKYFRMDPKISLNQILNERVSDFKQQIKKIDEDIKIQESVKGVCLKDISFYHYTDENLAMENYFRLFNNAEKEIYMTALPPSILSRLEVALYNAFMRGVKLYLYFSNRDFEGIEDYFDQVTDILSRTGISIIQIEERTCQFMRYNDIIVNNGLILIDEKFFNSILFIDDDVFHFDGFYGASFIKQSKRMLELKTVRKRIRIEYPEPIQTVIDIITNRAPLKTSEISGYAKIGGDKLREILDFLIHEGIIEERIDSEGRGRPSKVYRMKTQIFKH